MTLRNAGVIPVLIFFGVAVFGSVAVNWAPDFGYPTGGHAFTVGSEVRTFAPEPATGPLLGAGLGLLGLAGGGGRIAARRRSRQR